MFSGDRISAMLGAPPNHWKQAEIAQIKHIHRCYRNAYKATNDDEDQVQVEQKKEDFALDFGDSLQVKIKPGEFSKKQKEKTEEKEDKEVDDDDGKSMEGKRDEEDFLPKDSPLRSKAGDKKAPANATFKDHDAFVNSCSFDFWRSHFESQSSDKLLTETAQVIVSSICNAQSMNQLRVKKGNIPLRKKREHITPLALVLHELKMWATHTLRTANVFDAETFKEIKSRIKYLEALKEKEVWGDTANALAAGMRAIAHDKLLRLFLAATEVLQRAHDYSLRGYSQRSSREKLERIQNNLKDVVFNQMRLLSNLMILDEKLADPKTNRLQPAILLNSIENQGFVNYRNMVNVLLYRLCQNPLVRASFTGEYDNKEVKAMIDDVANWSSNNIFCRTDKNSNTKYLVDTETKIMPIVYTPTAKHLKDLMKEYDPKARSPLTAKMHLKAMKKAYVSEEAVKKVMQMVMETAAAIQEVVPSIYAAYQLWVLAGDAGDFTVYDTLRDHVIMIMKNTIERVHKLESCGTSLLKELGHLCKIKEEAMKLEALKTGKRKYKPAWVQNIKFIHTELLANQTKTYNKTMSSLYEVAKDAWDYNLTSDQINDKVESAKKIFNALTGGPPEKGSEALEEIKKDTSVPVPIKAQKQDFEESPSAFDEFGTNNAFGDAGMSGFASEGTAAYNPFAGDSDDESEL